MLRVPRETANYGGGDSHRVYAVVVTWEPDRDDLAAMLRVLQPQVEQVIVVDNGSSETDVRALLAGFDGVEVARLSLNHGIGYAQNVGVSLAMKREATHVLLMDQDSVPALDMVAVLLASISTRQDGHVAGIGPVTIDRRTGTASYFWRSGPRPWRWAPSATDPETVEVEFLIASGLLIPVSALRALGGMRSDYFIDHVDTEWCFRARAAGFRLLGSSRATMHHRIGDKVHQIWWGRHRTVAHHTPMRDYYMFRNTLLLLKDVRLPRFWRVHLLGRLVQFSAFFLLFGQQRVHRAGCMLRGLRDGWRGRAGRLRSDGNLDAVAATSLDPPRNGGTQA